MLLETVPTSCGSADKKRGRPRSRKPFPHWADRLYRIRTNPSDRELFASSTHRLMGADDIRVSVEQTEARIIGHESHGHDFPAGNSQRAWNRIERCTGIEPASPAWKAGALTVVLTPRKRNPRTRFTLIFSSGFLSGRYGPRTRTSTHRGWRAVHLHQRPAWPRVMIACPCVRLTEDSLQRRPVGTPTVPFLLSAGTVKIQHSCIALESNQRPPRYEQGALAY